MKYFILILYLLYTDGYEMRGEVNDRPIIGVLSQETYSTQHLFPGENYTSLIAASYVKDIESSGARVVPILIGRNRSYYEELLGKINGVVFPGGATYFNQSNGYADAGQHIYDIAQDLYDAGDYFPIFGTCLGFELLIILASGRGEKENRVKCYSYRSQPLNFTEDFRSSKMFAEVSDDVVNILASERVTVNAHQFCIVDENLKSYNLTSDWRVTSYGTDENGLVFISSIEHARYPFYGTQFHPETIPFEWRKSSDIPHTSDALKANRHFMDFFVKESRKSLHYFADKEEEDQHLIYNYAPKFSGSLGGYYEQLYVFEPRDIISKFLDFRSSKMFAEVSDDVVNILASERVTVNAHQFCIVDEESRKSLHYFADKEEEDQHLIYNYAPKFSGSLGGYYEQLYVFEPRDIISKFLG